jgi:hypothetical protein
LSLLQLQKKLLRLRRKKSSPLPPKKKAPPAEKKNTAALSLLQKIDQDLTKPQVSKNETAPSNELSIPASISKLHIEKPESEKTSLEDIRYSDLLIQYLENTLELPEKGEVKMRLELQADGQLLSLEILKAESKKNSEYLKNTLPALYFPCFNESVTEKKRKLIIRFCSQK